MNGVITSLQSSAAERIGWMLLHSLWQIALLAGAYLVVRQLLQRRSAALRYLAACAIMFCMVLALPLTALRVDVQSPTVLAQLRADKAFFSTNPPVAERTPSELAVETESPTNTASTVEAERVSSQADPIAPPAVARWKERIRDLFAPALPWIVAAWLIGVVVLAVRQLGGWMVVRRLCGAGTEPVDGRLVKKLQQIAQRLGAQRAVRLLASANVDVPSVVGHFKPVILLPLSLISGLTADEIEAILGHELAHIRRHDYLINLIQTTFETLLFYHPAVWWISREIRRERENCCDDLAVQACGNRAAYARTLAMLEENRVSIPATAMAASGGSLLDRIRRVIGQPAARHAPRGTWLAGALVMLSVCVILPIAMAVGGGEPIDFDFNDPPMGYEHGIRAAGTGHQIKAGGLQFKLSHATRGPDATLKASLGLEDGYEVVMFRLFDHATRKLVHDSEWQLNRTNNLSTRKFQATRVGETDQVRIAETGGTLPRSLDLWLRIVENGRGDRIRIPAKQDASTKHGNSKIVVTSLLAGGMSGKGSPSGKMIWDTSTAHNTSWQTTVDLENRGKLLRGRYHLVAVTKKGWRHAMNHKHFLDFSRHGRHNYIRLDVPLDQIDHFELIPFKTRHKFFFNGVDVPGTALPHAGADAPARGEAVEKVQSRLRTNPVSRNEAKLESDRDAMLAFARALAAGDFDTLRQTWEFQDDLGRQFARRVAEMFARARHMTVELVSMERLTDESLFACFLMRSGPGRFGPNTSPLLLTFHRKEGRWRCPPVGNLRSIVNARSMTPVRLGRRALAQRMIAVRFGPQKISDWTAGTKAQWNAFVRLTRPPYNLSQFEEIAEQMKAQVEERETILSSIQSWEDMLRLTLKVGGKDMLPHADDFTLSFYLEAKKGDPNSRKLPFADQQASFLVEPFPCLTEDAVLQAQVTMNANGQVPGVDVKLTQGGAKIFAKLTHDSVGKRLAIVVDGKVVSAPIIRAPILEGNARIDGNFTLQEAEAIAEQLNSYRKKAGEFLEALEKEARGEKKPKSASKKAVPLTRPTDLEARDRFLAIEHIARWPMAKQAKGLPHFYRNLGPRSINPMVEAILSSYPRNILDTKSGPYDGNTTRWAQQLADAASTMNAEQVADQLGGRLWLDVAARARALQIFKKHTRATSALIAEDLESREKSAVERAATAIASLGLRTFTDELLALYMADDELSELAYGALVALVDPAVVGPLLERVEQDPKFLVRCAGLFLGPLAGMSAEPLLLKLLDSPDAEIRYHAAYALQECRDPELAQPTVRLAGEKDARFRSMASQCASKLPKQSFQAIRKDLLPLLSDPNEAVRFDALRCFSKQKDLAAGPVILELLRREQLSIEQQKIMVMQALGTLMGGVGHYDMHHWGPDKPGNQRAIDRFEAWLEKQQPKDADRGTAWGKPVDGVQARLTRAERILGRSDWPHPAVRLRYDAKSEGQYTLHLPKNGLSHQVEVDGQWYEWRDPRLAKEHDGPVVGARVSALLDFEPGRLHEGQEVEIAGNWRAIPKGKESEYAAREHGSGYAVVEADDGKELVLTRGRHQVRIAVLCPSAQAPFHGVVRAVSEPLLVEIDTLSATVIEMPRRAGEISGVLLRYDGDPVPQATVVLCEQETGIPVSKQTLKPFVEGKMDLKSVLVVTTDAKGRFLLKDVPEGRYRVIAQSWPGVSSVLDIFAKNGKEITLHGVQDNILVPSEKAQNIVIKPMGNCVVSLDEDFPNSDALLLVSTEPLSADPVLGFVSWQGPFLQNLIGANRMPYGVTKIGGLPAGKIHLSVFGNDNNGGIGAGSVVAKSGEAVQAEFIPIVCGWSDGRHEPPEHLQQTFTELQQIATQEKNDLVPFLDRLLADKGIIVENPQKTKNPMSGYFAHLDKIVSLPSGREVRLADVLASVGYIQLQRSVAKRRKLEEKQ